MSHYGPPGGAGNDPYGQQPPPGQWPGGGVPPDQPYQQPGYGSGEQDPFRGGMPDPGGPAVPPGGTAADPFAQPPFGGAPMPPDQPGQLTPPGGYGPPPPDAWGAAPPSAPPPAPKKSRAGLVAVLVIVVVVVLGGGAGGWYFLLGPGKSGGGGPNDKKSPSAAAEGPPLSAKKGDCVVHPKGSKTVHVSPCSAAGALKVFQRIDHTHDTSKCPSPQTDFTYSYTDNNDTSGKSDFVLCLKSQ